MFITCVQMFRLSYSIFHLVVFQFSKKSNIHLRNVSVCSNDWSISKEIRPFLQESLVLVLWAEKMLTIFLVFVVVVKNYLTICFQLNFQEFHSLHISCLTVSFDLKKSVAWTGDLCLWDKASFILFFILYFKEQRNKTR